MRQYRGRHVVVRLGVGQTFAKVFSKFAVRSRKAESRTKVAVSSGRGRERRAAGPGGERVADGGDVGIGILLRVEDYEVSLSVVVGGD